MHWSLIVWKLVASFTRVSHRTFLFRNSFYFKFAIWPGSLSLFSRTDSLSDETEASVLEIATNQGLDISALDSIGQKDCVGGSNDFDIVVDEKGVSVLGWWQEIGKRVLVLWNWSFSTYISRRFDFAEYLKFGSLAKGPSTNHDSITQKYLGLDDKGEASIHRSHIHLTRRLI